MNTLKVYEKTREGIQGSAINDILLKAGRLTIPDMDRIVALQKKENTLFGEAAVALGILTEDDVRWALACQHSYPCVESDKPSLLKELPVIRQPFGSRAESFRSIRSGLILSGVGKIIKVVGVLSPDEKEGKTFIAANLAAVFAQLGSRTILVDLNFRKPRVHEIFHLKNNTGVSSLIIKRALFEQAVKKTPIDSLEVLASGPKPPNPLELLSWRNMRDLVETLAEQYDCVVIDTPAFSKTADAMVISTLCEGTVLVALKGRTRLNSFGLLKKQLDKSGIKILGSIMNEIKDGKKQ